MKTKKKRKPLDLYEKRVAAINRNLLRFDGEYFAMHLFSFKVAIHQKSKRLFDTQLRKIDPKGQLLVFWPKSKGNFIGASEYLRKSRLAAKAAGFLLPRGDLDHDKKSRLINSS